MATRQQQDGFLRIGELAERSGISTDTVRYYERLGLLAIPPRGNNGYRRYSAAALGRVQFIRRAKRLGLSLDDIRGLLGIAEGVTVIRFGTRWLSCWPRRFRSVRRSSLSSLCSRRVWRNDTSWRWRTWISRRVGVRHFLHPAAVYRSR